MNNMQGDSSYPVEWDQVEDWDTMEAWEIVFGDQEGLGLIQDQYTPAEAARLGRDEQTAFVKQFPSLISRALIIALGFIKSALEDDERDRESSSDEQEGNMGIYPSLLQVKTEPAEEDVNDTPLKTKGKERMRRLSRSSSTVSEVPRGSGIQPRAYLPVARQVRELKFRTKPPVLEQGRLVEFLDEFELFLWQERIPTEEVFNALILCIPRKHLRALMENESVMQGETWAVIKLQVRKLLQPGKTDHHYMDEYIRIRTKPGETVTEFHRRFNMLQIAACGSGPETGLQTATYMRALPRIWAEKLKGWLACRAGPRRGYESTRELQTLLEDSILDDPSETVLHVIGTAAKNRAPARASAERPSTRQARDHDSLSTVVCYNCQELGHYANRCPMKSNAPPPSGRGRGQSRKPGPSMSMGSPRVEPIRPTPGYAKPSHMRVVTNADLDVKKKSDKDEDPIRNLLAMTIGKDSTQSDQCTRKRELKAKFPPALPRPTARVTIAGQEFTGLVDTGADVSCIKSDILKRIPIEAYTRSEVKGMIRLADDSVQECEIVTLTVEHKGTKVRAAIGDLPACTMDLILGLDLITGLNIKWGEISADQMTTALQKVQTVDIDTILETMVTKDREIEEAHPERDKLMEIIKPALDANILTEDAHSTLPAIPIEFKNPLDRAGRCWNKQFRLDQNYQEQYEIQVQKWLDEGVIEERLDNKPPAMDDNGIQNGRFNVCTIPVWSNKLRFVQNFVPLNKLLLKDTNDVPVVEDALCRIGAERPLIYTKIDLRQAYLQIPLRKCDREVTAFTCGGKRYQFVTAPLGLQHIPSTFHRMVRGMLQSEGLADDVYSHLDDLLIAHRDVVRHAEIVKRTLEALNRVNLTINSEKSTFFATRLSVLGMIAEVGGIRPNPAKVCNIMEWERPTTKKGAQSFIGSINFFRRFIPDIAQKLKPLYQAMKELRFPWTNELERNYKAIAAALLDSDAFLHFPDPNAELTLDVDASKSCIGGVLYQVIQGQTRVIGFNSRVLTGSELNYTIPKKELLSAVFHIEHWRHWLTGREFHLRMDNRGIQLLLQLGQRSHHDATASGWATKLSQYRFKVSHVEGVNNQMADVASRVQVISLDSVWTEEAVEKELQNAHALGHFGASVMHHHITVTRGITGIPNLRKRCEDHTKACPTCRQVNTHRIGYAPLEDTGKYTPNVRWHSDILEMPTSLTGNRYILVILDEFTRLCILRAMPNKTADEVARHFIETMAILGFPALIKTDEGPEYVNEVLKQLETAAGIRHQFVVAYDHHANGLVERQNRTIRDTLLKNTQAAFGSADKWDTQLPITQLHLNGRFHRTLRATPFSLMFGRSIFAPAGGGLQTAQTLDEQEMEIDRIKEFWITFNNGVVPKMHKLTEAQNDKRKAEYKKKLSTYKKDDVVMYRDPRTTRKMVPRNRGPFKIAGPTRGRAYLVKGKDGQFFAPTNFLHRAKLRNGEELGTVERPEPADDGSEQGRDDQRDRDFADPEPGDRGASDDKPRRSRRKNRTGFTLGTGERTGKLRPRD